jgi:hypothetical protein
LSSNETEEIEGWRLRQGEKTLQEWFEERAKKDLEEKEKRSGCIGERGSEGAARKVDGVNREDGTSAIDTKVNRIGTLAMYSIASHGDLPVSSHQGVGGGFAQAVHKRFITEACSCIRVDETKDRISTTHEKTQTHTDCSRQCSETCV